MGSGRVESGREAAMRLPRPRFRLWMLMIAVVFAALVSAVVRELGGWSALSLFGVIAVGVAGGVGLSIAIDWIVGRLWGPDQKD